MKKCFTLLEILVVLAIVVVVLAIGWPALNRWQSGSFLSTSAEQIEGSARLAQVNAQNGFSNKPIGLKLFENKIIIFQGSDYNNRVIADDKEIILQKGINLAWQLNNNNDEIIFSKNKGLPSQTGVLILTGNDKEAQVSINEIGLIDLVMN